MADRSDRRPWRGYTEAQSDAPRVTVTATEADAAADRWVATRQDWRDSVDAGQTEDPGVFVGAPPPPASIGGGIDEPVVWDYLGGVPASTMLWDGTYSHLAGDPLRTGSQRGPTLEGAYRPEDVAGFIESGSIDVNTFQEAAVALGLIGPRTHYIPGFWDDATAGAFEELLTISNYNGRTWENMLDVMLNTPGATQSRGPGGGRGGGGGGAAVRLSNPEDLRRVFRQVARQLTGGVFLDDNQLDQMVKSYQGKEAAFQQAAMAGGTVTSPPSAEAFAAGEIEKRDPRGEGAVTGNRFAEMAGVLERLVGV